MGAVCGSRLCRTAPCHGSSCRLVTFVSTPAWRDVIKKERYLSRARLPVGQDGGRIVGQRKSLVREKEGVTMSSDRKTLANLIQDSIDKGATTVEEVHKSIADLPLKMLEGSERLRVPAKEIRHVQDRTIGAIYDLVRKVNEEVGTLATDLLAEATRRRDAGRAAGSKHRAARRAAAR